MTPDELQRMFKAQEDPKAASRRAKRLRLERAVQDPGEAPMVELAVCIVLVAIAVALAVVASVRSTSAPDPVWTPTPASLRQTP